MAPYWRNGWISTNWSALRNRSSWPKKSTRFLELSGWQLSPLRNRARSLIVRQFRRDGNGHGWIAPAIQLERRASRIRLSMAKPDFLEMEGLWRLYVMSTANWISG